MLEERPARSFYKNGIVERNSEGFEEALDCLAKENTDASPAKIVDRALFLTSIFKESRILSTFELARGYLPSVAGILPAMVPYQLLGAHVKMAATRAVHKTLKTKTESILSLVTLKKEMRVWIFLTRQNKTKGNGVLKLD